MEIKDGLIEFTIDKELGIEIIGDTKAKILVEDEDPWDIINDDIDNIDDQINEDYIKEE